MRPTVQQPLTVAAVPFALLPFCRPFVTVDPVMAATARREGSFLSVSFDGKNICDFCFTLASKMRFFPLISESGLSVLKVLMIFKHNPIYSNYKQIMSVQEATTNKVVSSLSNY